jgi:hypothetical protein
MEEDLSGIVAGTYGVGLTHTFAQNGVDVGETREFFIRAEVSLGNVPQKQSEI